MSDVSSDVGVSKASRRSLVLVVGSGRSGTSVFSGLLQRLGFHVPQPEVKPDESNPRGFAESKWVVGFHQGLLKSAHIQTSDARPQAWSIAAAAADDAAGAKVRSFLRKQFAHADHVLIKDPRLVWFLPLWRRSATELGITPRFVTLLRHPAAVIDSKKSNYGSWQGDINRTAGWLNTMLYTERATRDGLRAFVRYDELLEDWPRVVARAAEALDIDAIANASSGDIRYADEFVDPSLRRSAASWEGLYLPDDIRDQAEHAWQLLARLADKDGGVGDELLSALDDARENYTTYYRKAEAVAESSVIAAGKESASTTSARVEAAASKWIPEHQRRRLLRARKALRGMRADKK